ncbi:NB-ARC domain-containing protein [Corchorus capsularis]|uniref:NB-ARC domain-containing protein n=1 Tax=Corchorus capsularis TaxID=210143 RepID=A0A1R3KXR4_COCAP|nr:NB-ARC domain-containing protein [Corchorus capsularis]
MELENLAREMVTYCRGLPLAIVVLGGLLSSQRTMDHWDMVHRCIKSYFAEDVGVSQLFALSFDDLPYEMKPCLLYLGLLPEDFVISTDRLINLWVAEGLIFSRRTEREGEEALEDIAYRYLTKFAERYMVQVEKIDSFGRIKKCKMHDLMREFCMSKAEEENFFQVLQLFGQRKRLSITSSSPMVTGTVRRLSVHLNNFPGDMAVECEEYPPFSFKLLRVLDLEKVMGFSIPDAIGKLIHLRLLNLRSAWVGTLPPSIGNLRCLLTLRLDPLDSARTQPDVFWKLEKLRHLYLPREPGRKTTRLQFADLSDLRTLVNFPASVADVEDLIKLTNLRKLKIVISDEVSLQRLKGIFASPTIRFSYLRDFSINTRYLPPSALESQDVSNIVSRCPHLLRLKRNGTVIYRRHWE